MVLSGWSPMQEKRLLSIKPGLPPEEGEGLLGTYPPAISCWNLPEANSDKQLRSSLFLAGLRHMEFLGQRSDVSHSCSNARSLTHCAGPGIESATQCFRDTANPISPQQELQVTYFKGSIFM